MDSPCSITLLIEPDAINSRHVVRRSLNSKSRKHKNTPHVDVVKRCTKTVRVRRCRHAAADALTDGLEGVVIHLFYHVDAMPPLSESEQMMVHNRMPWCHLVAVARMCGTVSAS